MPVSMETGARTVNKPTLHTPPPDSEKFAVCVRLVYCNMALVVFICGLINSTCSRSE